MIPPAWDALGAWLEAWRSAGELVLLLDFDGTLAPIVERPEDAALPDATSAAVRRLDADPTVHVALVSGRGLHDVRARAGLPHVPIAGNHGMEIEGPGLRQVHPEAQAARPALDEVVDLLSPQLSSFSGTLLEDKGLTLSIHFRMAPPERVEDIRRAVLDAAGRYSNLRVTEGKCVLEVRPRIDWHKGRAVDFLLRHLEPRPGAPILYLGDDTTDEDAFLVLAARDEPGLGVIVTEEASPATAAGWRLPNPTEVGRFLGALAEQAAPA